MAEQANEYGFIPQADKRLLLEALDRAVRGPQPVWSEQRQGLDRTILSPLRQAQVEEYAKTSEELADAIQKQRRGILPRWRLERLAMESQLTPGDIKQFPPGTTLKAEEVIAMVSLLHSGARTVQQAGERFLHNANADMESTEAGVFMGVMTDYMAHFDPARRGVMAETGRALFAHGNITKLQNDALGEMSNIMSDNSLTLRRKAQKITQAMTRKKRGQDFLLRNLGTLLEAARQFTTPGSQVTEAEFQQALDQHLETTEHLRELVNPRTRARQWEDHIRSQMDVAGITLKDLAHTITTMTTPIQVNNMLGDLQRSVWGDLFFWYRYNNMLSSLRTQAVSLGSGAAMMAWSIPERFMQSMASSLPNSGSIPLGEAAALGYGYIKSIEEAFKLGAMAFQQDTPLSGVTKLDNYRKPFNAETFRMIPGVGRAVDKYAFIQAGIDIVGNYFLGWPTRMLMSGDEFTKFIRYRGELYARGYRKAFQQGVPFGERLEAAEQTFPRRGETLQAAKKVRDEAKAQGLKLEELPGDVMEESLIEAMVALGINQPLEEDTVAAKSAALEATLQTQPTSKFAQWVMAGTDLGPPGWPLGRLILPFPRVMFNSFRWANERTPFGWLAHNVRENISQGGDARAMELGKMAMGSMFALNMFGFAAQGYLTGHGPNEPEFKNYLKNQNWQPYSVKVYNPFDGKRYYVAFNRTDPFGLFMGLMADAAEAYNNPYDKDLADRFAGATIFAFKENLISKTWMRDIAHLNEVINPRGSDIQQSRRSWQYLIARNLLGPMVPLASFNRNLTALIAGPELPMRSINTMPEPIGINEEMYALALDILQELRGGVAWEKGELPRFRNVWGDPYMLGYGIDQGWLNGLVSFVNPIYYRQEKPSAIDEELLRSKIKIDNPARTFAGHQVASHTRSLTDLVQSEEIKKTRALRLSPSEYERYVAASSMNPQALKDLKMDPSVLPDTTWIVLKKTLEAKGRAPLPSHWIKTFRTEAPGFLPGDASVVRQEPGTTVSLKQALTWLITTPGYKDAKLINPDVGAENMVKGIVQAYRATGKQMLIATTPSVEERMTRAEVTKVRMADKRVRPRVLEMMGQRNPLIRDAVLEALTQER